MADQDIVVPRNAQGGGADIDTMNLGDEQSRGNFLWSVLRAARSRIQAGAAAVRRAVVGTSVERLFLEAGVDLHADVDQCWPHLFLRHPDVTINGFTRYVDVCKILVGAWKATTRLLASSPSSSSEQADGGVVDVGGGPLLTEAPTQGPVEMPSGRALASAMEHLVARIELLFFSAFPGSGKSHLCLVLAQIVGRLRRREEDAVRAVTDSSLETRLDDSTLEWSTRLQVLGLTFNNERWNLESTGLDGMIAHLPLCRMVPLQLRILFFAAVPLHDVNRAYAVWKDLQRRFYLSLKSCALTPEDVEVAVKELFARKCRRERHESLLLVVDELSKATDFCSTLYPGTTAADAFRSACCRWTSTVNGCTLLTSLDEQLAQSEFTSSSRPVREVLVLRPFPSRLLFERKLLELSRAGLYMNLNGVLERTSSGEVGSADDISARAKSLADIVGDDARFAVFLSSELSRARDGTRLSFCVKEAATSTGVLSARVWQQVDAEFVVAHVLLQRSQVRAEQFLPSRTESWDTFRRKGFVHARGGTTFAPRLPLYALHGLAGSCPQSVLFVALNNLVTIVDDQLVWRAWEQIWAHMELAFAIARGIALSTMSVVSLADMYKYRSYLGPGELLSNLRVQASHYPRTVTVRELPALLWRWRNGDKTLLHHFFEMAANTPGIDAVRFAVDEDGVMYLICYQLKHSHPRTEGGLSWGASCRIVRKMQAVLEVAAACATAGQERLAPNKRITGYHEAAAAACSAIDSEDVDGAPARDLRGEGGAGGAGAAPASVGVVDGSRADAEERQGYDGACGAGSTPAASGGSTRVSLDILDSVIFVVAAQRPCGGNFHTDARRSPHNYMDSSIVLTREDVLRHAGPFLAAAVEHYTDIVNISVTHEPDASALTRN